MNRFERFRLIGDIGQWISLFLNTLGLIAVIILRVDIGSILLIAGSLTLTIATKVKYYGQKAIDSVKCKRRQKALKVINS